MDSQETQQQPPPNPPPPPPVPTYHPAEHVNNIRNLIPITLDSDQSQYLSWVELFKITAIANNVLHHIDPSTPRPPHISSALWTRLDAIVKSWIFSTITPELLQTILQPDITVQETWNTLQDLFHNNKNTRILHLDAKFNSIKIDQFSNASDYCHALKVLADQLANLGRPKDNDALVLGLVKGLNADF